MKETDPATDLRVLLCTEKGDIALRLFTEQTPVTAANFVNLALRGYYDGVSFHRVIAGFMMQGGDPTGRGTGGPGYTFEDEFHPQLRFDRPGLLAMANCGPATNGSQFFITYSATPHLDDHHTIFGEVIAGGEVTEAIRQGDRIKSIVIQDPPDRLFAAQGRNLARWNQILDA